MADEDKSKALDPNETELGPSREISRLSGKESNLSSASGRKSRNLREAYHHLREEALRRYRINHEGDDPPEDWEPSLEEQDDIIRALSPRNDEIDPELLQAQADGAFKNIGTPRATPDLHSPHGGYQSPTEITEAERSTQVHDRPEKHNDLTQSTAKKSQSKGSNNRDSTFKQDGGDVEADVNPEVDANQHMDRPEPVDITDQPTAAADVADDGPNPQAAGLTDENGVPVEPKDMKSTTDPKPEESGQQPQSNSSEAKAEEIDNKKDLPAAENKDDQKQDAEGTEASPAEDGSTEKQEATEKPAESTESAGGGRQTSDEKDGEADLDDPVLKSTEGVPATDDAMAGQSQPPQPARATEGTAEQLVGEAADEPAQATTITDDMEQPMSGEEAQEKIEKEKAELGDAAHPEATGTVTEGMVKDVTEGHEEGNKGQDGEEKLSPPAGEDEEVRGDDENIRGDEHSVVSDEVKEDKPAIPDDFYYDYDEVVSKPFISENSGLPSSILQLSHSFGYDCLKRGNLCLLDKSTIAFATGNLVQIINLDTKEQRYLRSTGGGAIGAICVHPNRKWLAVAEKGEAPDINIYSIEDFRLHRILRGGTQQSYAYVCFSPDGKLLASVGGDPDYMLTLWNWKAEQTVLRSKAFSQDVFKVSFSTELEGQLTSAGTGHIRFWKMAHTFTGLKLQGQLGKFGKTEISDIEGYVELPDGKVLSGCENGNMLLWDGGLIKVEIGRKGKKPCHSGPIQQIILDEGELMSVGIDGCIRVWDFETVDTADSTDESGLFEMEPMNEIRIGAQENCSLRYVVKSIDEEEEPTIWYAQDANGGIWKLDLSFSHTSTAPERMLYYHAGSIAGCSTSPVSHLVVTTGVDKSLRVYDYVKNNMLCETLLNTAGTSVLWAPKLVDTKGATILAGFEDGVVRCLVLSKKDEKNRKGEYDSELLLAEVFKPHVKAVTCMAFDSTGETLATASEDGTVFFFSVNNKKYQPIGFVDVAGPVTHISWTPSSYEKTKLLVCCSNGFAQEVECPEPGKFDTSHSFQLEGLSIKTHQFQSVKSQLRRDEELERKRLEEEAARKKKEEERRKKIERGLLTESDDEEEEEKKEEEEEEWKPYIPATPSAILAGYWSKEQPGTFWLSMDDFDAGYLYQCKFREETELQKMPSDERYLPVNTVAVNGLPETPISVINFSETHEQVLMGIQTGVVRVQPLPPSHDITETSVYWSLAMHDNHQGSVTGIAISHDGTYVISVGQDGNFFVYNYMSQKDVDAEVQKAKIPSALKLKENEKLPDDIDDPNAYSIEDAKQKAEHDKMMKEAEERKQEVRRIIAQLRRQFKKLLEKNHELPPHLRLNSIEFEMDPEIKKELAKQTQDKIDTVKKELAWESEKQQIALDKLKTRFKAMVECERIIVKSFTSTYEVSTYRAAKLSDDFYALKAELEQRRDSAMSKAKSELSRDPSLLNAGRKESSADVEGADELAAKAGTNLKGSMGQRIQKALQKVEDKKKKRAARRTQWDDLYNTKPDDNYEDPADVAAISEAQENMGDYKLKTADDYIVPDHLRMNVEKAIMKLLVFKELIHEMKYMFNQRVLSLRDRKMNIVDQVTQQINELIQIRNKLGEGRSKPLPSVPTMHPDELPERKMEYTRESLLTFKADMEKQAILAKTGGEQGGFGGFGGGGGGAAADKDKKVPVKKTKSNKLRVIGLTLGISGHTRPGTSSSKSKHSQIWATNSKEVTKASGATDKEPTEDSIDDLLEKRAIEPTALELQIKKADEIRLAYQQDHILKKIDETLSTFDAELRCLYLDKLKLDVELKNADLRYITLFEEFLLLKEYEKHENLLGNKVAVKQQEKIDQQNKTLELNQKIELKKKDIEKLQEKEKGVHAMFVQSLGDNNKFADYLTKVFKKKIKRSKKKENAEGGSDDESEEESSDEEDWSESDDESGSEGGGYDLDICPPGCDQNLYNNTTQLRERRLDIEEVLTEEKKLRDQMVKDAENMTKKTKVIMAALKSAEADLEAFQLEKQQKLNEFEIVVTLNLHQVLHHEHGKLPNDLQQCLVFRAPGLVRLSHRIKELEQEKAVQKRQQKDAKKKHVQLLKDRKMFEAKIGEMEATCDQEMILKFGRIVDLEQLEQVTVNRQVEELKEKLRITEIECSEDLKRWEEKIRKKKNHITKLIRENTNRIETLNMLQTEKRDLEVELDSKQKSLGGEFSGVRKADIHERQRLIQLVQLQAQEIDALKEEIVMLSHKGGHILPPAQPPVPGHMSTGSAGLR